MPEGPEVETDNLRETIEEEHERGKESFLKRIALTTALFAALAAISALRAGATVNEALMLRTEAARLQAEASDQWSFYQAKGIKASQIETKHDILHSVGKEPHEDDKKKIERYREEQKEIEEKAKEKEHASEHHMAHHVVLARAVTAFQVAIALSAVSVLSKKKLVWFVGLVVGAIGAIFLVQALV